MNESQFRDIYKQYEAMVRTILLRMAGPKDLDDLVQECFVKIFQGIDGFKGQSELRTWIYRVAVNTANDYLRARKRRSWLSYFGESEAQDSLEAFQINSFDQLEAKHDIEKLLQELSPKLRETITLFSIDELSLEDVSRILQIPEGTVKSRINLAKMQMSEILKNRKS